MLPEIFLHAPSVSLFISTSPPPRPVGGGHPRHQGPPLSCADNSVHAWQLQERDLASGWRSSPTPLLTVGVMEIYACV